MSRHALLEKRSRVIIVWTDFNCIKTIFCIIITYNIRTSCIWHFVKLKRGNRPMSKARNAGWAHDQRSRISRLWHEPVTVHVHMHVCIRVKQSQTHAIIIFWRTRKNSFWPCHLCSSTNNDVDDDDNELFIKQNSNVINNIAVVVVHFLLVDRFIRHRCGTTAKRKSAHPWNQCDFTGNSCLYPCFFSLSTHSSSRCLHYWSCSMGSYYILAIFFSASHTCM